jgi:nitrogen fixation protein NifX
MTITGLRIAVATTDGTKVDEHFGRCRRFDVYEVNAEGAELTETRDLGTVLSHDEGAIDSRLSAIKDCAIVHVTSIGAGAAARVVNAGVMPLKLPEGTPVAETVGRLQTVLQGTPPPWLRKLLRRTDLAAPRWSPS